MDKLTNSEIIKSSNYLHAIKKKIATEVISDFNKFEINLKGKTVLDVGSGLGFNTKAMQLQGASVYGVEPDVSAYTDAIQLSNLTNENSYHGKLQDIPKNLHSQFDIATVFLWNIPHAERDGIMQGLRASLTFGGTVIIGLHDEVYISDPHGVAVEPLAKKYFSNVVATGINIYHHNRQFLICK